MKGLMLMEIHSIKKTSLALHQRLQHNNRTCVILILSFV